MSTEQDSNETAGGGSALNVELDINRLIVDIKHLRIDNAQLQYALEQSETIVSDLAILMKRLVHSLRRDAPDNRLTELAMNYLQSKQLLGESFRDEGDFPKPIYIYIQRNEASHAENAI